MTDDTDEVRDYVTVLPTTPVNKGFAMEVVSYLAEEYSVEHLPSGEVRVRPDTDESDES